MADLFMSLHSLTKSRRALHPGEQSSTLVFPICRNPLLRLGLETVLAGGEFIIWHEAVGDLSTLPDVEDKTPVLFIIEIQGDGDEAVDVISQVKSRFPDARIVMLADRFELGSVSAAWEAGAHGFCLSGSGREVLVTSLELVMLGEVILPSSFALPTTEQGQDDGSLPMVGRKHAESSGRVHPKLSAREAQILEYLRDGASNKVIARRLNLSESTVKVHVKAILKKVGAYNRTQAALWAARQVSAGAET
jgi:two-component system nitrate/nitrite response regulator NarL